VNPVELFKIRMQGQYGALGDKKLRHVAQEMWSQWGFRQGIMRGFWVRMNFWSTSLETSLIGN
jgi:solute carrier family 25 (mitochondrial carnitine/acylcarnitine transporter), member 20/29